jgi:hypothetical protein
LGPGPDAAAADTAHVGVARTAAGKRAVPVVAQRTSRKAAVAACTVGIAVAAAAGGLVAIVVVVAATATAAEVVAAAAPVLTRHFLAPYPARGSPVDSHDTNYVHFPPPPHPSCPDSNTHAPRSRATQVNATHDCRNVDNGTATRSCFVPLLAIPNATRKQAQMSLRLMLHLPQLSLREHLQAQPRHACICIHVRIPDTCAWTSSRRLQRRG